MAPPGLTTQREVRRAPKQEPPTLKGNCTAIAKADVFLDTVLSNRYHLKRLAGNGGLGRVYEATDTHDGSTVAVKVPNIESLHGSRDAIRKEAIVLLAVTDHRVIDILELSLEGNFPYIVLEFLKGRNLAVEMERVIPLKRIFEFTLQLTEALEATHSAGIIHRDVKPANIFVMEDGNVKLLDFGISEKAKVIDTPTMIVGTPAYSAPEIVRGQAITQKVDIYSAGVVLYEMLTETLPYNVKNFIDVLGLFMTYNPRVPSEIVPGLKIPPEIDALVMRAIAKYPGDRFQTAAELRKALLEHAAWFENPQ